MMNKFKIKPSEVQSSVVLFAFREQMDWEIVKKESRSIFDKRNISCAKEKINKHAQPCGHNFKAVVHFKEYCDKNDKFYIYRVRGNDGRGNADMPSGLYLKRVQKKYKLLWI